MLSVNLPRPPTTNNLYATNKATGRRYRTKRYETWLVAAGYDVNRMSHSKVSGDIQIVLALGRDRNKDGSFSKRRMDADNFIKATLDLLTKHKLIDDDSYAQDVRIFWTREVEPGRVQVRVLPAVNI